MSKTTARAGLAHGNTYSLGEFHIRLRDLIERLEISQSRAAELLGVSRRTIETWVASPGTSDYREPIYVTQVGALTILMRLHSRVQKLAARGQYTHQPRWRITNPNGTFTDIVSMRAWARETFGEENFLNAAKMLIRIGRFRGYSCEKLREYSTNKAIDADMRVNENL